MGGSNQKPAQPSTPKNHTWGKKRVQLIVGGVAVCAALSLSGIAFAAAGGGSSVTWDAMEKEQPPVPIEQAEAPKAEADALPVTGAADKKDAQEQPKAEAPVEDKKPADEVAASVSNPVADGKNTTEQGSRGSNEPAGADVKGGADGKEPADAASDPQGDAQAEPAPEAPAAEDPTAQAAEAAPAKAVVKLSVEPADQGAVAYAGATYRDGDSIEAEAPADFALTVSPAEGYEVESVTVIRTAVPLEGTDAPAAAPGAGTAAPLEADAAGAYVVSADAQAATYQVSVTLRDARINSWENLKAALEQGGDVRLDDSIVAKGPLTITADTTLDLAGHNLTLPDGEASEVGASGALITVQSGTFTLTDSTATPLKSQCRAEKRGVQAKEAGQLASYDAASHELTYYVTTTKANRTTGTTFETRHEEHLNLGAAGAIEAQGIGALVEVRDGAAFAMDGGRLTNAGGAHAVKAGDSTVTIVGNAAIVGSGSASASGQDANGAGIYQAGGTLTVGGNAAIAANVAANNGGGVYLADGKATIGGNAVVAGNKASEDAAETDGSNEHPDTYNGGGIYVAKAASLTVSENAVFSGNRARRDGGGIYVAPRLKDDSLVSANRLVLTGATITNNRSDAVKERTGFYVSGGGGIFSMGDTAVDGAVITSNRAADAGGGLAMPGEAKYQMPLLAMTNTVVAANLAEASEGGGMFCHTAGAGTADQANGRLSYVTTGTYITNNRTNTVFDYGGGGLFVPVDGFLNVVYPVVSRNEASGLGGGVGACSNSTVITQDAAIFDNKALGENHTTNPNEYGDRWAMLAEDKGPGPKGNDPGDRIWDMKSSAVVENTYDQYDSYNDYRTLKHAGWRNEKGEVEPLEANDFFSAHRATVYGTMLGGHDATSCPEDCESSHRSEYNWTGWMSASPAQGEALVDYAKYGVAKVTLPGEGGQLGANSSGPRANNLGWYLWVKNSDFDEELALESAYKLDGASVELNSYQSGKSFRSSMTGFYELGLQNAPNLICLDFKRYADGGFMQNADSSPANKGLYLKADGSKLAPRELEAATRTEPLAYYRVYHIDKFPEGNGFAQANRIMALTADPSAEAKVSARSAACVFVTGNSSNTNGGGIGCNGFIHIGRPDPNVPDEPTTPDDPTHFGSFRIVKTLERFPETEEGTIDGERATVVFHVVGYQDKESVESGEGHNVIYDAYHALEFDANDSQEIVLGRFPAGSYFTVTEVSYSGANFEIADGESATQGVIIEDDTQEGAVLPQVNFRNTYKDDGHKTSGVVNTYTKQDGSYTVTQKWSKTQVVVPEPAEGDEPQTPADES